MKLAPFRIYFACEVYRRIQPGCHAESMMPRRQIPAANCASTQRREERWAQSFPQGLGRQAAGALATASASTGSEKYSTRRDGLLLSNSRVTSGLE